MGSMPLRTAGLPDGEGSLDCTGNRRKHIAGVGTEQPDSAYRDRQYYREHDGVLRDILPIVSPKSTPGTLHLKTSFNHLF